MLGVIVEIAFLTDEGKRCITMFKRSLDGSGRERGMFVKTSLVVDFFSHVRHSKTEHICP